MQDVKLKYLIVLGDHVSTLMEHSAIDAQENRLKWSTIWNFRKNAW